MDQNVSMIVLMVVMLAVGVVITSLGGIVGPLCGGKESTVVIESGADRVRIELTKWAVSSKGTQATENAQ